MKLLGLAEVSAFVEHRPQDADMVRAWAAELTYRNWDCAEDLAVDFRRAEMSHRPRVVFFLDGERLRIETLIDFGTRTVLVQSLAELVDG